MLGVFPWISTVMYQAVGSASPWGVVARLVGIVATGAALAGLILWTKVRPIAVAVPAVAIILLYSALLLWPGLPSRVSNLLRLVSGLGAIPFVAAGLLGVGALYKRGKLLNR